VDFLILSERLGPQGANRRVGNAHKAFGFVCACLLALGNRIAPDDLREEFDMADESQKNGRQFT